MSRRGKHLVRLHDPTRELLDAIRRRSRRTQTYDELIRDCAERRARELGIPLTAQGHITPEERATLYRAAPGAGLPPIAGKPETPIGAPGLPLRPQLPDSRSRRQDASTDARSWPGAPAPRRGGGS